MRVNWAAVGVSGIVYWLFQAGWFNMFARPWQAGLRMSPEQIAAYNAHPNYIPFVIALLCNLVIAFIIVRMLALGGVWTMIRGFRVGLLVGIALAAAILTQLHFEDRPHSFILISAGCPLAGCILMGLILGAWKPKLTSAETTAKASQPV
jgi:hypothetical protein